MNEHMNDRDLLVTIANDITWLKSRMIEEAKANAKDHDDYNKKIMAAHRRVDWLMISGVLAIIFFAITVWLRT